MTATILRQGTLFARVRVVDDKGKRHTLTVCRMEDDTRTQERAKTLVQFFNSKQ